MSTPVPTFLTRSNGETLPVELVSSTCNAQDVHDGYARAYICYNGTSTVYGCFEQNFQDALDAFADAGVFDTQGPLSQDLVDEMYEEFPDDGPGAAGYFSAGGASEWFNGSYLRVEEVRIASLTLNLSQ